MNSFLRMLGFSFTVFSYVGIPLYAVWVFVK